MAKFPSDMPEKTAPVDNDFVLLADSQDNDEVKKVRVSKISASSVIDDTNVSVSKTYSSSKIVTILGDIETLLASI